MVDEFRDCFVGEKGYDALKKLMKNGNDFCIEAAKCLQERNDAEIYYVKALRKTSDNLQKLAGRTKGSVAQAFTTLAKQTDQEAEAHSTIASILLNDISMPLKNLADAQAKDRKQVEDSLYKKFKEWNTQKEYDLKYRLRQFDKSREIETLTNKISEVSSTTRTSSKSKGGTPLVISCVLPGGRYTASDKSASNSDTKHHAHLEASIRKAEEDLERAEEKYHRSTKDVEVLRQACDIEMNRSCDELQKMEFNRITEIGNFITAYVNSIQTLTEKMRQITQELNTIQVSAQNDIIVQARSNVQPAEFEILLYDIYAEREDNVMGAERRILSLMKWMEMLKKDIEIQQQTKNTSFSSLSSGSNPRKSNEDPSPDDDDDGAMCSSSSPSKKDVVRNSVHHRDNSSSSSNDDDGAMHHTKREKKKNEGIQGFSSVVDIDRRGAALLEQLYRASLFKIESVYNRIKSLRAPAYEHEQRITRTYSDKGCPTTLLRLPSQPLTHTPPSAPPATEQLMRAMPMYMVPNAQQQPQIMVYAAQQAAPPPLMLYAVQQAPPPQAGWSVQQDAPLGHAPPVAASAPLQHFVFPHKESRHDRSAPPPQPMNKKKKAPEFVRALYDYDAQHKDELSIKSGDVILVIDRRDDDWIKGNLHEKIGLFPGNYVEDMR